jgi:polyisoprenoid-binding protein YceI
MKRTFGLVAAALLTAAPALAVDVYEVDKAHSEAVFQIRHLMSRVSGRFGDIGGTVTVDRAKPQSSSVEFTIKAASIDTNNDKRDNHLRSDDFFAADKHPEITFKSTAIKPKGSDAYDVTGVLSMRGVSKEMTLPVTVLGEMKDGQGNPRIGFEASTTLNRKDYGIVWNQALDAGGFVLGDDVKVTVHLSTVKKKSE